MTYPSNEASDTKAKDFLYIQLQVVLDQIPSRNTIILRGDMNTKVGSRLNGDNDVVGLLDIEVGNDNSARFVDLCKKLN